MTHITGEVVVHRPVEEVFDFVADERNEPRYNPHMRSAELTSAGPIGRGSTFRAQTIMRGQPVGMTITVTEYERPRRLTSATHLSNMDITGTLTFDPVPEGTRMRWSWRVAPRGLLKLLSPLVAAMGRRQERTIWTSLKRYLETRPTSAPLR